MTYADRNEKMRTALKEVVVPQLRRLGFKGTFPHFSRRLPTRIDLLSFQFSLYGPTLYVEAARCGAEGVTLLDGSHFPPEKVRSFHTGDRIRLSPPHGDFEFDASLPEAIFGEHAKLIAELIEKDAEPWWRRDS